MKLRDAAGPIADDWARAEAGAALAGPTILTLDDVLARGADLAGIDPSKLGLHVPNDVEPEALRPWLDRVALMSIDFPSFADGRGFSIARRLRRMGFRGRLRAFGPVISDQATDLWACGFDEIETPQALADRQPEAHWAAAGEQISLTYQRGFPDRRSILEARRAAAGA